MKANAPLFDYRQDSIYLSCTALFHIFHSQCSLILVVHFFVIICVFSYFAGRYNKIHGGIYILPPTVSCGF